MTNNFLRDQTWLGEGLGKFLIYQVGWLPWLVSHQYCLYEHYQHCVKPGWFPARGGERVLICIKRRCNLMDVRKGGGRVALMIITLITKY